MDSREATMVDGVEIGVVAVGDRAVDVEGAGDKGSTVWLMVTKQCTQ